MNCKVLASIITLLFITLEVQAQPQACTLSKGKNYEIRFSYISMGCVTINVASLTTNTSILNLCENKTTMFRFYFYVFYVQLSCSIT